MIMRMRMGNDYFCGNTEFKNPRQYIMVKLNNFDSDVILNGTLSNIPTSHEIIAGFQSKG